MADLFGLGGRHALVTGASSGLGRHFAGVLAAAGAKVTVAARREAALAQTVESIRASGAKAQSVRMDVTDAASIEQAFAEAEAQFGPVTILINNAGVTITRAALDVDGKRLVERDRHQPERRLAGRAACGAADDPPRHRRQHRQHRLHPGLRVAGGIAPYAISKAGVVQMTKALALEWARHGIRVNALAPGYIETDLNDAFFGSDAGKALIRRIPQRRLGETRELDGPLLLLASDAGSYMTGSVIAVDGGHLVSGL